MILLRFLYSFFLYQSKKHVFHGLYKPSNHLFPLLQLYGGSLDNLIDELLENAPNADFINFGSDFSGNPIVAIANPDIIRDMLTQENILFGRENFTGAEEIVGNGLATVIDVTLWKKRRRILTPVFHFGVLKDMIPTMVDEANQTVRQLQQDPGKEVKAHDIFNSFAFRVIIRTTFGNGFDVDWMERQSKLMHANIIPFAVTLMMFGKVAKYMPWTFNFQKYSYEFINKCLEFITKKRKEGEYSKSDLAGLLLSSEETVDDAYIVDEVRTFLAAGHETTSNHLSWTMYFLAKHPDVQEKIFEEVKANLEDSVPNADSLSKLRYIKAVLEESIRLRPIVPTLALRVATQDVELGGRKFPKDTRLLAFPMILHWNEKHFPKAKEFIPERFLNDEKHHPFSFLPFGAGQRNCIGQKFALQESTILLALLIHYFKVVLVEPNKVKPMLQITQIAENLYVKFLPRAV